MRTIATDNTTITREVTFHGSSGGQTARIVFVNGVFSNVQYTTANKMYSRDDWSFLKEICDMIDKLEKEDEQK